MERIVVLGLFVAFGFILMPVPKLRNKNNVQLIVGQKSIQVSILGPLRSLGWIPFPTYRRATGRFQFQRDAA